MKSILLPAAICLLCILFACQNSNENKDYLSPLNDSTSVTGLTGDSVKLVKTASIRFKVKAVEQSIRTVSELANKYGGMLTYQNMEAVEGQRTKLKLSTDSLLVIATTTPQAEITARVPSQHLEGFLFGVTDLGYYTSNSNLRIDDRSLAYLENVLKQKNRSETLAQAPVNKKKAEAVLQTIALKDEAVEQQIANRAIDVDVAYSTVNLTLFQNPVVRREVVANTNIGSYQLPFWSRVGNAFKDGWAYFLDIVVALAHLWVFILAALLGLFAYKFWTQKRKAAL